jgi:hypothetical protein
MRTLLGRCTASLTFVLMVTVSTALGGIVPSAGTAAAVSPSASASTGWSDPVKTDSHELDLVSCPSTSFCLSADNSGDYLTFNGHAWSAPTAAPDVITQLSCASSSFCAALGQNNDAFLYNGQSWSTPQTIYNDPNGTLDALSCGSSSFCVAADGGASDVSVVYDGSTWAAPDSFNTYSAGGTTYVTAVSCSGDFCAAGDFKGQLFTLRSGSWSGPTPTITNVGITAISCSSSSFCLASDPNATSFKFNGSSWSNAGANPKITALSCVSASFCEGVGATGVYTYNGSSWVSPDAIPADAVSCVTTTFCIAVSGNGDAYVFTGGTADTGGSGGSGGASPPNAKVTRIFGDAGKLIVDLSCPAGRASCGAVSVKASVTEHLTGGRVTAVSAGARTERRVLIAQAGAQLQAGKSRTVTIALNGTGHSLLAKFHKLTARVTVASSAGQALKTATIKLSSPPKHRH